MELALRINEANVIRNLRYAFTDRFTVITELLQNARRSGSPSVWIDYDDTQKRLSVRDFGCGIVDFQDLFSIAQSGWSPDVVESDRPFGLGFMQCLYAATHCTVRSLDHSVSFSTDAALSQDTISAIPCPFEPGTLVELQGVDLPGLDTRIANIVAGFPIPVFFNGKELPRPFALDALPYQVTCIGHIHLRGWSGEGATTSTLVFLQGILVRGNLLYGESDNVVHLDSSRFLARRPDRQCLIDEDAQRPLIDGTLKSVWRGRLLQQRESVSAVEFTRRFFAAARTWRLLDVLDDVPVLPGSLFCRVSDYPYQEAYGDRDYLSSLDGEVSRETVESGCLSVVELDTLSDENTPLWMYAYGAALVLFYDPGLTAQHWIHRHVRCLDDACFEVSVVEPGASAGLDGQWISPKVTLCNAYAVCVDGHRVEFSSAAMYWPERHTVLVPPAENTGQAVRQVSNYLSEGDHWEEGYLDADTDALAHLIRLLRATDPCAALAVLLADLRVHDFPCLRGRSFALRVPTDPGSLTVELAATAA